uniref:DUF5645 domain-containing protein n=1 Tax=Stomoxys calcitrans TaxID=35570 RepID=A0A1I8NZE5_STOCA
MSDDILVECNKSQLKFMLDYLRPLLPRHLQQHHFIYSYLYHYERINNNRHRIDSDRWNVRFYTHRKGQPENCTLITLNGSRDYIVVCFTLDETKAELKQCLQQTNRINWQNTPFSMLCDEGLFDVVNEVLCQKNPIDWLYPPREKIFYRTPETIEALPINVKLPDDLFIAPLDHRKHAKIMDDHWYYKHENSLPLIRHSIEFNGGLGIFRHGEADPIAWITTNEYLTPGFLYTKKSERCKGYGELLTTLELKRTLKINGLPSCSFISVENKRSLAMNRKLRATVVGMVTWIEKPLPLDKKSHL